MFIYRHVYKKISQSDIMESRSFEEALIRSAKLSAIAPVNFQLFTITLLHHSILFLNNTENIGYDDFKVIIHDFIQVSFEQESDLLQQSQFTIPAQINIIACILSRLLCDYLSHVKVKMMDNKYDGTDVD